MNSFVVFFCAFALVICGLANEIETPVKYCKNGQGECVKSYLCQNGTLNVEGSGLVNPRFAIDLEFMDECGSFLITCCDIPPDELKDSGLLKYNAKRSEKSEVSNKCGIRNVEGVGIHVTNTKFGEAQYGEFPWMAAILELKWQRDELMHFYLCGGSLIRPEVILTIAHCIHDKNYRQIQIRLGEWDTQTENEIYPHQDIKVSKIVVHPSFKSGPLHNDIALIFMEKEASIMNTVNTICLPEPHFIPIFEDCFASGWGKDKFDASGQFQTILKSVKLPVVMHDECQVALRKTRLGHRFRLHKSMICAGGDDGVDTCVGDGGSPLVCRVPNSSGNQYYQVGIVSWGIGCGRQDVPAAYTNVAYFDTWINDKINEI